MAKIQFGRNAIRKPQGGKTLSERHPVQLARKERMDIDRAANRKGKPDTTLTVEVVIPGGRRIARSAFMAQVAIDVARALLGADDELTIHAHTPDKAAHHRPAGTAADLI